MMQTLAIGLLSGLLGLLAGVLLWRVWGGRADRPWKADSAGRIADLERRLARQSQEQLIARQILTSMGDGVLVVDDRGTVLEANQAAAELLETTLETLTNQPLVRSARSFPALPLLDRAQVGGAFEQMIELPRGRLLIARAIPLETGDPREVRVLLLLRDVTATVRTDRMRRDFVANVSHELKTPLARLALLASSARHAVLDEPEQAQTFLASISTEVSRLGSLVNDLLTLSEVEEASLAPHSAQGAGEGPGEADAESVDLARAAASAAHDLRPAYEAKAVTLDCRLETAAVAGNLMHLETMVRNLLDNALRYSDPGGRVELTVSARDDSAVLVVRDQGLGIPRDAQERIFERFFRVDPARSRETGGTGLGLSIVRHVAELQGGEVKVESAVGLGSTFTVTLPLAQAAREAN